MSGELATDAPTAMRITTGFEIVYDCPAPAPMLLVLSVHPSRRGDLEVIREYGIVEEKHAEDAKRWEK